MKSNLFSIFESKGKKKKSGEDAEKKSDCGWTISRTAGSTSNKTLLVNDSDKKLVLRDKISATYGGSRYEIPGHSEIEVTTLLQNTFFQMRAYAIEEVEEEGKSSSANNAQQLKKTKKSIDTKLTIDSDRLADSKKIVIWVQGSQYKIDFINT